jgi:hypothetical protein
MKRALLSLAALAVASASAFAGVTKEDLKKLISAGVGDDVVIAFIRANGGLDPLSADDVVELKGLGASDKLLAGVLDDKAPAAKPAPAPDNAAPVLRETVRETVVLPQTQTVYVERPVYVPQPTYYTPVYYRYPAYSYSYVNCGPRYSYPRYHHYSHRPSFSVHYGSRSHCRTRGGVSVGFRW